MRYLLRPLLFPHGVRQPYTLPNKQGGGGRFGWFRYVVGQMEQQILPKILQSKRSFSYLFATEMKGMDENTKNEKMEENTEKNDDRIHDRGSLPLLL